LQENNDQEAILSGKNSGSSRALTTSCGQSVNSCQDF
jgi:hypothetical protein